jgi:alkylresorcinol/alkylpyrone synthase
MTTSPLFQRAVNAGIDRRYSCVPLSWYEQDHSWPERNTLYLDHAVGLMETAARRCLDRSGMTPEQIDALVVVSSSGIATPALDALLMQRLPFRSDVRRLPIFGLGCVGGVVGLARTAALAQSAPDERILFLVVEPCALTFRRNDRSKSNIVATALFGDGAAAALVTCAGDAGPVVACAGEHTWPDTLDVMGWSVEKDGLGVIFSRDIPALIRRHFPQALESFLKRNRLRLGDIDQVLCHPGGAKVLDALEEALGLAVGGLTHSRAVLREYGNMSAVTVLFVLDRALAVGDLGRRVLLTALGPGFTAGFLVLENDNPSGRPGDEHS